MKKLLYLCSRKKARCGNSSDGRARPCQGRCRGFEPRFPLKNYVIAKHAVSLFSKRNVFFAQVAELVDALVSGTSNRKVVQVRVLSWAQDYYCFGKLFIKKSFCASGEIGIHATLRG